MKITDLKVAVVKGNFDWTLVKVYTDEGVTGIGEAYWGPGVKELAMILRGALIGEDPRNVDRLYKRMYRGMVACGSTAGVVATAISGIEIALWDVLGKKLNTPVYSLLGGKHRDRVRVYADCGSIEAYARKVEEVKRLGYTALKFDIDRGLSRGEVKHIVGLVGEVMDFLGDDLDLALDCHWQYNVKDAIRIASRLEDYDLLWLEDPVPPENIDAMAKVAASTRIPICTGENLYTRHGFRELIEKQAADIIAPDMPKVGGLLESRRIADMADMYYIPIAPHNVSSPIGTIAAAHVCAAITNFLALEFHALDVPWWDSLVKGDKPLIKDGYINIPNKPGLGVELNEEEAVKHLKEGEALFD